MDPQAIQHFLTTTVTELGIKILAALAFWFVGRWLIHRVIDVMRAAMNRNNIDPTLIKYLGSIVKVCREAGWPAPTPSQIVRQG